MKTTKTTRLAATLMAMCVVPAQAATFTTPPVPLDETSELVIAIVNTCTKRADYTVVTKNAINGAVLLEQQGALAPTRGTALPFSWGATQTDSFVYQKITWECRSTAQPRPLISFTVRDLETKVPRFVGTTFDDTAETAVTGRGRR